MARNSTIYTIYKFICVMLFFIIITPHGIDYIIRTDFVGQRGLSEAELEDILSCDDDVLHEVLQFCISTVRRLPPFWLIRMMADIREYLGNWREYWPFTSLYCNSCI